MLIFPGLYAEQFSFHTHPSSPPSLCACPSSGPPEAAMLLLLFTSSLNGAIASRQIRNDEVGSASMSLREKGNRTMWHSKSDLKGLESTNCQDCQAYGLILHTPAHSCPAKNITKTHTANSDGPKTMVMSAFQDFRSQRSLQKVDWHMGRPPKDTKHRPMEKEHRCFAGLPRVGAGSLQHLKQGRLQLSCRAPRASQGLATLGLLRIVLVKAACSMMASELGTWGSAE